MYRFFGNINFAESAEVLLRNFANKNNSYQINNSFSSIVIKNAQDQSSFFDLIILKDYKGNKIGFISGKLFTKPTESSRSQPVKNLNFDICKKIIDSNGLYLTQNYWGQYLIILQDLYNEKTVICTDPMGFTSLFYTETNNGIIFSSDLEYVKKIANSTSHLLDKQYLIAQLSNMGCLLSTFQSPFKGIYELLQGQCLIISKEGIQKFNNWDPYQIAQNGDFNQERLLSTFLDVVAAWEGDAENILTLLSGGLDSSSLLLALNNVKNKNQKLLALTYGTKSVASSDESIAASRVANLCEIEMMQYDCNNPWSLDKDFKTIQRPDRPHPLFLAKKMLLDQEKIISKSGCRVVFSGHGGDQIFCEGLLKNAIADYWIDKKFTGILENLINLCNLHRVPMPFMIRNTFFSLYKYYFGEQNENSLLDFKKPSWLLKEYHDQCYDEQIFKPYLTETPQSYKPGKSDHIVAIYQGNNQLKVFGKYRNIPIIYPFYSQPLVEEALKIPVYETYDNAHTRAPFRNAISNYFKTDLVYRKNKGETSGVLQLGIQQNINRVNELCLEGFFARNNMLDKRILAQHIKKVQYGKIEELHFIINLLSVELWCEQWNV